MHPTKKQNSDPDQIFTIQEGKLLDFHDFRPFQSWRTSSKSMLSQIKSTTNESNHLTQKKKGKKGRIFFSKFSKIQATWEKPTNTHSKISTKKITNQAQPNPSNKTKQQRQKPKIETLFIEIQMGIEMHSPHHPLRGESTPARSSCEIPQPSPHSPPWPPKTILFLPNFPQSHQNLQNNIKIYALKGKISPFSARMDENPELKIWRALSLAFASPLTLPFFPLLN